MITLYCIGHPFLYELECTLRIFYPGEKIEVTSDAEKTAEFAVTTQVKREEDKISLTVRAALWGLNRTQTAVLPGSAADLDVERTLSTLLFTILSEHTGIHPPWGILTGVRPLRLCRRWKADGLSEEEIHSRFEQKYIVRPEKAALVLETAQLQQAVLEQNLPDTYSLYVSIPFCPTRCLYCSFVSHAVEKAGKIIPEYIARLCDELRYIAQIAQKAGMRLLSIYVGGGTPTSITPAQLEEMLGTIAESFDLSHLLEYTVEAGRPDTISREKLLVLKKYNVDRISINPQTMQDDVLQKIGRRHTAGQVVESYTLARELGFSNINMDLIAGLPGDTAESFESTLDRTLELKPENITLHTLTVKRSSTLRGREDAFERSALDLQELLNTAEQRFRSGGYAPYYLYRQKGTVQNLENTGWTLPGKEGAYNIYSMEDVHTILGAGAGAVTKLCAGGNPKKRLFNFKYPYEYIAGFEEMLNRKAAINEWRSRYGYAFQGTD